MLRASVPEAAIDKDSHARPREDDVGPAAQTTERRYRLAEPIAAAMELRAKRQLGPSVNRPIALHHRTYRLSRRWRRLG